MLRVEVLFPPSSLFQSVSLPVMWTFEPRQTLVFGRPMELRHPITPGRSLPSCVPLTVLERSDDGTVSYKAFTMCFFRLSSPFELAVVMDHTTFFQQDLGEREAALAKLLERCLALGREADARSLETEVYAEAEGEIAFPSTLSLYDGYNDAWLPNALLRMGFHKTGEQQCLTSEKPVELDHSEKMGGVTVRPWRRERLQQLWTTGLHLMENPHNLVEEDVISRTRFNSLAFWRESASGKEGSGFVSVAEKGLMRKSLVGAAFWLPNLYSVAWTERTRLYYMAGEAVKERLRETTGKVFKLIVDREHFHLYADLIADSVQRMRAFGVSRFQVGNIPTRFTEPLNFLKERGFRVTHTVWKMRKELG